MRIGLACAVAFTRFIAHALPIERQSPMEVADTIQDGGVGQADPFKHLLIHIE